MIRTIQTRARHNISCNQVLLHTDAGQVRHIVGAHKLGGGGGAARTTADGASTNSEDEAGDATDGSDAEEEDDELAALLLATTTGPKADVGPGPKGS